MHINWLKKFVEKEVIVLRLDVIEEEEEDKGCVLEGDCAEFVQNNLDGLIEKFGELFSDEPGLAWVSEMGVNTGEVAPIRQAPYSVPLNICSKVKNKLECLERQGIIEPADST